jgi:MFS family permease
VLLGRKVYYGWWLVLTLGVTETTSWGVLYYAFSVFITPMEAELGWSRTAISGAFSVALLVSGAAAVPVGRWLDRRGGRLLMTAGSAAGALLVFAWSRVTDLAAFYLVWAAIGATMAAVLYEPAFAILARWFVRRRARAFTALTLMAGFASTIFIPLAGWLVRVQGWRPALVTLALVLAGTVPAHALLVRRRPEDLGLTPDGESPPAPGVRGGGAPPRPPLAGSPLGLASFRWLAAAFCLNVVATVGLAVHLVAYLEGRGYDPAFAAAATGAVGAMQVVGRLLFAPLERRLSRRALSTGVLLLLPAALLVLLLARSTAGVWLFVALFGIARGTATLTRANLVAELYGAEQYGRVNGLLAFFITMAQAVAPILAGAGYDLLGAYDPIVWAFVLVSAAAAAAVARAAS